MRPKRDWKHQARQVHGPLPRRDREGKLETVLIALVSGVTSAIITQLLIYWREARLSSKAAGDLALRLANAFDSFAAECITLVLENYGDSLLNARIARLRSALLRRQ